MVFTDAVGSNALAVHGVAPAAAGSSTLSLNVIVIIAVMASAATVMVSMASFFLARKIRRWRRRRNHEANTQTSAYPRKDSLSSSVSNFSHTQAAHSPGDAAILY